MCPFGQLGQPYCRLTPCHFNPGYSGITLQHQRIGGEIESVYYTRGGSIGSQAGREEAIDSVVPSFLTPPHRIIEGIAEAKVIYLLAPSIQLKL
ncbi:unnamed protein product [marine sediment metagenome]|uniref:Uncharacterized protein n=1 Tax=marine sediment metagenome TaxID=412755 RepID=X1TBE0_9ZZZZ